MQGASIRRASLWSGSCRCEVQRLGAVRQFHVTSRTRADEEPRTRSERARDSFAQISRLPLKGYSPSRPLVRSTTARDSYPERSRRPNNTIRDQPWTPNNSEGDYQTRGGSFGRGGRGGRVGRGGGRGGLPDRRSRKKEEVSDEDDEWKVIPTNMEMMIQEDGDHYASTDEVRGYAQIVDTVEDCDLTDWEFKDAWNKAIRENGGYIERPADRAKRENIEQAAKKRELESRFKQNRDKSDLEDLDLKFQEKKMANNISLKDYQALLLAQYVHDRNTERTYINESIDLLQEIDDRWLPRHEPGESWPAPAPKGTLGDLGVGSGGMANLAEDYLRYLTQRQDDKWQDPHELTDRLISGELVKFRNEPERDEVFLLAERKTHVPGKDFNRGTNVGFEAPSEEAKKTLISRMASGQYADPKDVILKGKTALNAAKFINKNYSYSAAAKKQFLVKLQQLLPEEFEDPQRLLA